MEQVGMTKLTVDSLEFAREHIEKFYDSDFFPRAMEFGALWHSWEDVKKELLSKNINKFWVTNPKTSVSSKPRGGFRVVQQLDPIDTLVYTALGYSIATQVEQARISTAQHVACSYRFSVKDGSFFSSGNGFGEFTNQSEHLADNYKYVLATDITDFYNQIYLHRLNNAIEYADAALKPLADDIERFISNINGKTSQGVPVGPAASIVMAEAVMMDIDSFLINKGVYHTRYVDDFRVFSNSKETLLTVLEELTLYLYKVHRLTLSTEKTKIIESDKYVSEILHNHYELERVELFETLEIFNPYSGESEEVEIPIDDEKIIASEQITILADRVLERKYLDLGLSRALVRKAKTFKIKELALVIFENFEFFAPIVNDVCLYLSAVSDNDFVTKWKDNLVAVSQMDVMQRELVRTWYEWYISNNINLLKIPELNSFVMNGNNICNQAQAAISTKNLSWVRDKKDALYSFGEWDKRAIIMAAQVLPSDEKNHWLKPTESSSPVFIDRLVAKWVREAF